MTNNNVLIVVRIDISTKAQASPYAMLKIEDLENWEKINGRIPSGAVVVLYSAWGQHYPNPYAFFGTPTPRDATTLSYPGKKCSQLNSFLQPASTKHRIMFLSSYSSVLVIL
jgi:hypothetical protein